MVLDVVEDISEMIHRDHNYPSLISDSVCWVGDRILSTVVYPLTVGNISPRTGPVSYTHLDVYKRQVLQTCVAYVRPVVSVFPVQSYV